MIFYEKYSSHPFFLFNMRHQQLFNSFFSVTVLGRAWDRYIPEPNVAYNKFLQNIGDRTPTLGKPVISSWRGLLWGLRMKVITGMTV